MSLSGVQGILRAKAKLVCALLRAVGEADTAGA